MTEATETLNDSVYDKRTAHIYVELTELSNSVLVVVTNTETETPIDKYDVLDALQIAKEEWEQSVFNKKEGNSVPIFYSPPLTRGWVQVGILSKEVLEKVLMDNNYIPASNDLNDISDIRAFTAKPVDIRVVEPGEPRPFEATS